MSAPVLGLRPAVRDETRTCGIGSAALHRGDIYALFEIDGHAVGPIGEAARERECMARGGEARPVGAELRRVGLKVSGKLTGLRTAPHDERTGAVREAGLRKGRGTGGRR